MLSGLESLLRTLVAMLVVVLGWGPSESVLVGDGPIPRALSETVGVLGLAVGGGAEDWTEEILDGPRAEVGDTEALDGAGSGADRIDGGSGPDEADSPRRAADTPAAPDDEVLDDAGRQAPDPATVAELDVAPGGADLETLDGAERVFDDFENLDDLIFPEVFDDFEDLDDAIVGSTTVETLDSEYSVAPDAAAETGGVGEGGGGNGGGGEGRRNGGEAGGGSAGGSAGATDAAADRDCADFASQAKAQTYFDQNGGSVDNDVDGLDRNGDGQACEDFAYAVPGGGDRRAGTGGGAVGDREGGTATGTGGGGGGGGGSSGDGGNGGGNGGGVERGASVTDGATDAGGTDRDCADFLSQAEAQTYFVDNGGSVQDDIDGLDRNGDGRACADYDYGADTQTAGGGGRRGATGGGGGGTTDTEGGSGGGGGGGDDAEIEGGGGGPAGTTGGDGDRRGGGSADGVDTPEGGGSDPADRGADAASTGGGGDDQGSVAVDVSSCRTVAESNGNVAATGCEAGDHASVAGSTAGDGAADAGDDRGTAGADGEGVTKRGAEVETSTTVQRSVDAGTAIEIDRGGDNNGGRERLRSVRPAAEQRLAPRNAPVARSPASPNLRAATPRPEVDSEPSSETGQHHTPRVEPDLRSDSADEADAAASKTRSEQGVRVEVVASGGGADEADAKEKTGRDRESDTGRKTKVRLPKTSSAESEAREKKQATAEK